MREHPEPPFANGSRSLCIIIIQQTRSWRQAHLHISGYGRLSVSPRESSCPVSAPPVLAIGPVTCGWDGCDSRSSPSPTKEIGSEVDVRLVARCVAVSPRRRICEWRDWEKRSEGGPRFRGRLHMFFVTTASDTVPEAEEVRQGERDAGAVCKRACLRCPGDVPRHRIVSLQAGTASVIRL